MRTVALPPRPSRKLIEAAGLFEAVTPTRLVLDLTPVPDPEGAGEVYGIQDPPLICTYCGCELFPRGLVDVNYKCGAGCACPSGGCVPVR